jgi:hypothetical protein
MVGYGGRLVLAGLAFGRTGDRIATLTEMGALGVDFARVGDSVGPALSLGVELRGRGF